MQTDPDKVREAEKREREKEEKANEVIPWNHSTGLWWAGWSAPS